MATPCGIFADDFYGDGRLWEFLWNVNKDSLRSGEPQKIYSGEAVLVPLDQRCAESSALRC